MPAFTRSFRILGFTLALTSALSAAQAAAKETVKIAFVGPLSGGNSAAGVGARNSAQLAVKERNSNPNSKYEYTLVALDDECKPNIGIQVATKIAADKSIIAALPHYCSAVGIATIDIYHKFKLPVVFWGAILPAITYRNDYPEIHRVSGTMINESRVAAEFLAEQGYRKIVIVRDTTDFGNSFSQYFTEEVAKGSAQIVAQFPVSPDQQDLSAELTKIKELKPDLVFLCGLTPLGVRLRTQMERVGLNVQLAAVSGIMTAGYIEGAGPIGEGTLAFHNGAPLDSYSGGDSFLRSYKAAGFREDPDAYGPFAYVAANLTMDSIEKVGPNRAQVTKELSGTKNYKSLVGNVNFDDHRQNIVNAHVYVVQNGAWAYWPRSEYASGTRKLVH